MKDIPSRILHITKVTGVAGSERHLLILLGGLRARGVDAELLLLTEPGNPVDEMATLAELRGIPVHRIVIRSHVDLSLVPRLARFIRRGGYDAVHTHLIHADLHGAIAAAFGGARWLFTTRHNDNRFRLNPVIRALNRALWAAVDRGIAISESLRRFCIGVEGAPPGKVVTIYYGIEPPTELPKGTARAALRNELGLRSDAVLVGMACRLVEQKGVVYALRGFEKVAGRDVDAHLVIAGDGPLRESLEAEAHESGLDGRVHFLGWRDDVQAIMAGLDVFLMPSLWEGFGMALLEAMGQSLPIVATRVSAIPEIVIEGETGLLVPPSDPGAIAKALNSLLADPASRREMGARGRARLIDHFGADRMVEKTIKFYGLESGVGTAS